MSSSAPSEGARLRPHVYGRRKGPKLSAHQAGLFETLLPMHAWDASAPITGESWLEIGFGAGEHLLWQAQQHPHVSLIGAEPYEGGVAKLLSKLAEQPAPNLRIHMGDARDILAALPDASLGRVFILFPDPWPKTRHHKRRFIQTGMLDMLARLMKSGAELRFASDDAPLVEYTLERLMAHPSFEWLAASARDWTTRPPDWPPTRYEAKQLHGIPAFLAFRRV